ncbi:DUF6056 family protein [Francisella adeliensis]|uniref:Uncharacterized protein n=1 Tax=Francisella adeliensis TaxID=2007306 RepID=A0A2Z4XYZ0_9GAMM|nr:DUF6056 family protein [Francisella adeliensis]AXA34087.1 hypothetical protein CDH04_06555 [Francisella adeliensis]MBK2085254.1 hypothetical protein [Francisella adeliensis]MBK2095978.1 hypothetical protein [Francisella adeliensis]QIW12328.1 hypothetical protein FZC43_06555 [Francisella adeliensis]QIW14202.1 hypothetical protein FZC44_06555 [Francisella adeliensis]
MIKKYFPSIVIALVIIGYFFFLNFLQPLRADDFGRACTDTLAKGLIMMVHSIQADYGGWTGRVSAQGLIYLLLSKKYILVSTFIVNIVNAISFYVFMLLSFKIVTSDRAKLISKDFLLFSFFFMFIFYQTGFIANVIWKTGAIQYFWGITLLVVLYYVAIEKKRENLILGLLVGSLIGLYNEIFVCVTILLCLAYFLERWVYRECISDTIIAYFVSCAIGGCILIAAPGNYARLDYLSAGAKHISLFSSITNLLGQIVMQPQYTAILLLLVGLFLVLIFSNKEIKKIRALIYSLTFIISIFVLVPVAKSYDLNQRVLLIYYALFFIAAFKQFYKHDSCFVNMLYSCLKKLSWLFAILLLVQLFLISSTYIYFYKFEQSRNQMVEQYHKQGEKNPVLPNLATYMGANVFLDDITSDKQIYNNKAYAEFYGFDSVTGEH